MRDNHIRLKLSGGAMAQCLGLMNGIYASLKLRKKLEIWYYPYSTGTYWPFAISPLLSTEEKASLQIKTQGLMPSDQIEIGKVMTEHPLMTRYFSYEKLLSLLRKTRLEPYLQFARRELAIMGLAEKIVGINKYYQAISGGFATLNINAVIREMHNRFLSSEINSPFVSAGLSKDLVVIHFRLGDKRAAGQYPTEFNSDGIIDPRCFADLLSKIGMKNHRNVIVVSDEPKLAQSLLNEVNIKARLATKTGSIWDDIYLMSQANIFVGSNSQVSKFASICIENNGGKSFLLNIDNQRNFYNFSNTTFVEATTLKPEHKLYSLNFNLEESAHSAYKNS
jgi:hypothetical protein